MMVNVEPEIGGNSAVGATAGAMALLLVSVLGCTTPPVAPPPACPALPRLESRATEAEIRRHHHTVIALYAQCAGSKP